MSTKLTLELDEKERSSDIREHFSQSLAQWAKRQDIVDNTQS